METVREPYSYEVYLEEGDGETLVRTAMATLIR